MYKQCRIDHFKKLNKKCLVENNKMFHKTVYHHNPYYDGIEEEQYIKKYGIKKYISKEIE
jgi:hypothetical protein